MPRKLFKLSATCINALSLSSPCCTRCQREGEKKKCACVARTKGVRREGESPPPLKDLHFAAAAVVVAATSSSSLLSLMSLAVLLLQHQLRNLVLFSRKKRKGRKEAAERAALALFTSIAFGIRDKEERERESRVPLLHTTVEQQHREKKGERGNNFRISSELSLFPFFFFFPASRRRRRNDPPYCMDMEYRKDERKGRTPPSLVVHPKDLISEL